MSNSMGDRTAKQRYLEVESDVAEALSRLDVMESRVSSLEESVNKAVGTLMPKVDSLLSGRTRDLSESTASISSAQLPLSTSALDLAAHGDTEALLQLLAAQQVDVLGNPQRTDEGDTALHVAASGGHVKAVIVLLGAGAKADCTGRLLRTPLHCAAAHGHLAVAQRLLDMGARVDVKDADGATPLDLAAGQRSHELVHLLLKKGAQPKENSVSTAAKTGHWNLVELFLQGEGAFVNACSKEGHPLIVLAAKDNRWEIVNLLLEKGASGSKCKYPKQSALVYASKVGQADVVRKLLQRGAAREAEQIERALDRAKSAAVVWAFMEVVPNHVRGPSGNLGLVSSARDGRHNVLKAFLEAGVHVDGRDARNLPPLFVAAGSGKITCVRELLQRGANINWGSSDGNTALHAASSRGHVECVVALLEAGAYAITKNKEGKTPLEVASSDAVREAFNREIVAL